jgi:hypothetical protein
MSSWKPEVLVINDSKWYDNGLRFETKEEAEKYAHNLAGRWTSVRRFRASECEDLANHRWIGEMTVRIGEGN